MKRVFLWSPIWLSVANKLSPKERENKPFFVNMTNGHDHVVNQDSRLVSSTLVISEETKSEKMKHFVWGERSFGWLVFLLLSVQHFHGNMVLAGRMTSFKVDIMNDFQFVRFYHTKESGMSLVKYILIHSASALLYRSTYQVMHILCERAVIGC